MTTIPLTRRQRDILTFLHAFREEHSISPTYEEIAAEFGVNKVTIFGHVRELERKGAITRGERHTSRSIQPAEETPRHSGTIQILGLIAAGAPIEAIEDPEELCLSDLIPPGREVYALRVKGDSMIDAGMAPPGKHMMTVFVQYAPPRIDGAEWTDADRDRFGKNVIDQIAKYSPDVKDLILHCEVRTPREIEDEVGLTEGNIFMGELTFDQLLFNRPFPGYAQYRGPVKGMYMCGSGTHPGGGVMAAPGANAAREILLDLKLRNTVPAGYADD